MIENNFGRAINRSNLESKPELYVGPSPRQITNPVVYIALISPGDNLCNLSNQLILDGTANGYTLQTPQNSQLNGVTYSVVLGVPGLLSTINAVNSDKVLKLTLESGSPANPLEPCIDTPYGFKLSQLFGNMGAVSMLTPTNTKSSGQTIPSNNGWTNMAHLIMSQRAFRITKNGQAYTVFNFTIKNVGKAPAQKVLFKDIIPEGATLCQRAIFVKYTGVVTNRLTSDNYELNNNRQLFILLKNLQPDMEATISIVCIRDNCSSIKRVVNVGALTYVAYQGFDNTSSPSNSSTVIVQQISNPKPLI